MVLPIYAIWHFLQVIWWAPFLLKQNLSSMMQLFFLQLIGFSLRAMPRQLVLWCTSSLLHWKHLVTYFTIYTFAGLWAFLVFFPFLLYFIERVDWWPWCSFSRQFAKRGVIRRKKTFDFHKAYASIKRRQSAVIVRSHRRFIERLSSSNLIGFQLYYRRHPALATQPVGRSATTDLGHPHPLRSPHLPDLRYRHREAFLLQRQLQRAKELPGELAARYLDEDPLECILAFKSQNLRQTHASKVERGDLYAG